MIARVTKGDSVNGLSAYLWGQGRRNEHDDPHLVAAWDEHLSELEPELLPTGKHAVGRLGSLMRQPVDADPFAPEKFVYHLSLRTAPEDRVLSDAEWSEAARECLAETGLARPGDDGACRWFAMRHGEDHIHVVVTLARQDGGRVDLFNDYRKLRAACHRIEERFELRSTAAADKTADYAPGPKETSARIRATRPEVRVTPPRGERGPTVRDVLRARVQVAVAGSNDVGEFKELLAADGVTMHSRMSEKNPDQVTGVSFSLDEALGGKRDKNDQVIRYSGSKLAPDLAWTKLAARWTSDPSSDQGRAQLGPDDEAIWSVAEKIVRDAAARIGAVGATDPEAASDTAWAASDVMRSAAAVVEGHGGGPLTDAADAFARAGRETYGRIPVRSESGSNLRLVARALAQAARSNPASAAVQVAALTASMTALARALADLREAQHRTAQAQAARLCAARLSTVAPPSRRDPARPAGRGDRPDTTFRRTKTRLGGDAKAATDEGTQKRPGPTQGRGRSS